MRVAILGLCGSDLNSFRGRNPMLTYPRIPGHELSAIVEELVGFHAAARGRVASGETVAVFGCGARTIAVDVDDRKLELARRVGAPATFVSRVVALEEAGAALAQWSADPGGVSKIHVDVGGVL